MIVYEAKFPNGKRYIGLTIKSLERRKIEHKHHSKHSNRKVYNAIRKYGWENVIWKILTTCSSEEEMKDKEKHFIKKFRTLEIEFGYNHREGGQGGRHDEETKRRISLANSGENNGMYGKDAWNKGKKLTKEHKENLSKAHQGQVPWNKGKKRDYEVPPLSQDALDRISKKNGGSNNGMARLTENDVREIRRLYDEGDKTLLEISEMFGISKNHCLQVARRKVWKSVKE